MTKGQEAANVLAILVNRIKPAPDFTPTYQQITQILSSVSDIEWESIVYFLEKEKSS